ncbi:hypothetical protein N0V95_006720 [Ascochyta clinopodiicola]|nr:hypothetical protein N0V95_006720 [Ascochyta clinopodiicola]
MEASSPFYARFLTREDEKHAVALPQLHAGYVMREKSLSESLELEQAHDDEGVKQETDCFLRKSESDDGEESDSEVDAVPASLAAPFTAPLVAPFAVTPAVPLVAPAPVQAKVIPEPPGIENTPAMVTVLSKRMNKIHDLKERERFCRAEMERIGVEVGDLKHRAIGELELSCSSNCFLTESELLYTGQTNWLLSRVGTLSGQKAIIQMILAKIEQRNLRRQAKLRRREQEKQRQKQREAELKVQLEAKRQSNKQQLRSQSALEMQVPHLDLTAAPKPNTEREAKVVVKIEPEIKVEPYIKVEED